MEPAATIFGAPKPKRILFDRLPGGGYAYTLLDDDVRVEFRYLRRDFRQLHGEVDVLCDWAGARRDQQGSLSCADLNLSSQRERAARAQYCAKRAKTKPDDFDWEGVFDDACRRVIQGEREGDDVIVLDDASETAERDFNIHGLRIPADAASMLIAHGDSLKSMLLLYFLGTLAQRGRSVLYLDWEWTADRHAARKRRLFGLARLESLRYLRLVAPLTVEADRIRRFCDLHGVEFLGLDSVGLASDGKLADDDTAIRFHRALGNLPPSLCAAHVPKSSLADPKGDPEAFGSVFFTNFCRASWSVKKQAGATGDVVTVGLFPKKQNDGARNKPIGLEFSFSDERINVRPADLAGVEGLADRLPIKDRMVGLLKRGPLTLAEIAQQLNEKVDSVIKASKRSDRFVRVSGADGIDRIALAERHIA
jgi:hypothetical protein